MYYYTIMSAENIASITCLIVVSLIWVLIVWAAFKHKLLKPALITVVLFQPIFLAIYMFMVGTMFQKLMWFPNLHSRFLQTLAALSIFLFFGLLIFVIRVLIFQNTLKVRECVIVTGILLFVSWICVFISLYADNQNPERAETLSIVQVFRSIIKNQHLFEDEILASSTQTIQLKQ